MRLRPSTPIVACGLLALAALLSSPGAAQEGQGARSPYRTEGGRGSLRTLPDGSRLILLEGGAHVWNEEIDLTGDLGRYFTQAKIAELVGNAKAVTESLTLRADSLRAYELEQSGDAFGNVRLETYDGVLGFSQRGHYERAREFLNLVGEARVIDGPLMVQGDSITMLRRTGVMEAFGTVSVVDEVNRSVVTGEHGRFERESGLAVVDSLPRLRSRRGDGPVTAVDSDWMSFDRAQQISTAIGNVDFRQGTTQAHADTARFLGEDLLVMSGSPSVQQEGRVMNGEVIRFHYLDSKLDRIEVWGGASLVDSSPDTLARAFTSIPLANTLSGDSLSIWVRGNEITRAFVKGNAHSVYLPEDQDDVVSVNDVKGESIDIRFDGGTVDEVLVEGTVQGTYRYFERGAPPDSTAAASDSLATDVADTLAPPVLDGPAVAGLDSTVAAALDSLVASGADSLLGAGRRVDFATSAQAVEYQGSTTLFKVQDGRIKVGGTAKVKYGTLELFAEDIHFDTDQRELLAEGDPRLVDRESELVGDRMGYLFEPKTGAVADGATRMDDGYYTFTDARRMDQKTMLVRHGTYTTCDLAEPHYHFLARKMKLKIGESVVARQVTFHLSNIPVMALPFYYKSLDSGRHSGILFPNVNLGVSSREGRYIRDLGYYWATNDYTDFQFLFGYNEREKMSLNVKNVYNVRYGMNGESNAWYIRQFSETREGDEWRFNWQHTQPELFDVWSFRTRVELSSSKLSQNSPSSLGNSDLISSRLYSTASLSRTFDSGISLNVNGSREQFPNSEDDDFGTNNRLSNLNLSVSPSFKPTRLFPGRHQADEAIWESVLRDLTLSYSNSTSYARSVNEESRNDLVTNSTRLSLSFGPENPLWIFDYSSRVNANNTWTYRNFERKAYFELPDDPDDPDADSVWVRDAVNDEAIDEADNAYGITFTNGLSTKLYGIFDTNLGPVRGIKHTINWNGDHNYRPGIRGGQSANQDFSFSLNQDLSFKLAERGEEGEDLIDEEGELKTRKLDNLLSWGLSTSFDPDAAPAEQWRDISSRVTIRPGVTQAITFNMSQTIDAQTFELNRNSIESTLRLRGGIPLGGSIAQRTEPKNAVIERLPEAAPDTSRADERDEDWDQNPYDYDPYEELDDSWLETGDRNAVPWDLYLRGSVSSTRSASGETNVNTALSAQANVSLPGQWKLSWRSNFNIETGTFNNQFWTLERKLHDWNLVFKRGLTDGQDFGFSIYLNAIPDLRVDRGDLARSQDYRSRVSSF